MVPANPPMVAPVPYPGGVKIKPPFEMGVANFGINECFLTKCRKKEKTEEF